MASQAAERRSVAQSNQGTQAKVAAWGCSSQTWVYGPRSAALPPTKTPSDPTPSARSRSPVPSAVQIRTNHTPKSWAVSSSNTSLPQVTGDAAMLCPLARRGRPAFRSGFHKGGLPAFSASTTRRRRALKCRAGSESWGCRMDPPGFSCQPWCTLRWSSALTTRGPGRAPGKSRQGTSSRASRAPTRPAFALCWENRVATVVGSSANPRTILLHLAEAACCDTRIERCWS